MSRKPTLKPCTATIQLLSVPGRIEVTDATLSTVVAAGTLEGGAKGVRFDLRELRNAIDIATARLYPDASKAAPCMADIQIVAQPGVCAPMLVISDDRDNQRPCAVVAGGIPEDDPRTPIDAIEAWAEVQE